MVTAKGSKDNMGKNKEAGMKGSGTDKARIAKKKKICRQRVKTEVLLLTRYFASTVVVPLHIVDVREGYPFSSTWI